MTRWDVEVNHEDLVLRFAREFQHILECSRRARRKRLDVEVVVFAAGVDFVRRVELVGSQCLGLQGIVWVCRAFVEMESITPKVMLS